MLMPLLAHRRPPRQISYTRLGENRGSPRLWLEGLRLPDIGFTPGSQFRIHAIPELNTFTIELATNGTNTVSGRNRYRHSTEPTPIIDINRRELADTFGSMRLLRALYYDRKIIVQAHSQELNRIVALDDLTANVNGGLVTMASVCVGGGICSQAIHEGLAARGVETETSWVIDIDNGYLQSMLDNTHVAGEKTTVIEGRLGDVEVDLLKPVNILNLSLPCTGFSQSGRAKNRLDNPESHTTAGTTILKAMEIVERLMPPVIVNENVVPFASSASADLMAGRLRELGYQVESRIFGGEMGTLEDRRRVITVASHPGLGLSMDRIVAVMQKEQRLADVLDNIPLDDPMWKSYDYLANKAERDAANGKNFKRQLLTGDESSCGVLGAGYMKARSTEPFLIHPTNPTLSRLLTREEHARVMKIPTHATANVSKTVAHEIMGQSGSYALFAAIGQWLATELQSACTAQRNHIPTFAERLAIEMTPAAVQNASQHEAHDDELSEEDTASSRGQMQLSM